MHSARGDYGIGSIMSDCRSRACQLDVVDLHKAEHWPEMGLGSAHSGDGLCFPAVLTGAIKSSDRVCT